MIEIIPAIDLINGKCVRLSQGDFSRSREYGDPLEMAKRFESHGMRRLHLVDLDGAREKRVVNYRVLERIAAGTDLVIDAGGGIRSDEDLRIVFESGARMATGGTIAVTERDRFLGWLARYGPDRIILGADFREGKISVSGWEEHTEIDLVRFLAEYSALGIEQAICTDITLDGLLEGPSFDTYRRIRAELGTLCLIASGGVSRIREIEELDRCGIGGVIVGKAIYEGRIPLEDLERFIIETG